MLGGTRLDQHTGAVLDSPPDDHLLSNAVTLLANLPDDGILHTRHCMSELLRRSQLLMRMIQDKADEAKTHMWYNWQSCNDAAQQTQNEDTEILADLPNSTHMPRLPRLQCCNVEQIDLTCNRKESLLLDDFRKLTCDGLGALFLTRWPAELGVPSEEYAVTCTPSDAQYSMSSWFLK